MKTLTYGVAATAVLAGAALGLAGPASAESPNGMYTATITQSNPPGEAQVGDTMTVMLNPCGPDCTTLLSSSSTGWVGDLRLQGDTWAGPVSNAHSGTSCNATLDNGSLALILDCPSVPANVQYALAKKG
jgi:hypothetical protein